MPKIYYYYFLRFIYFIFRQWGRKGEREGEKHQCVVASHATPMGDLAHNPGMCPDWESNWQPYGSQASTQSTEPHQPGQDLLLNEKKKKQVTEHRAVCII